MCRNPTELSNIAVEKLKIRDINKLANGIRLQFNTKEDVEKAEEID